MKRPLCQVAYFGSFVLQIGVYILNKIWNYFHSKIPNIFIYPIPKYRYFGTRKKSGNKDIPVSVPPILH